MQNSSFDSVRADLKLQKLEFEQRLARINENHRRPLETDSKERALQLENREVIDALGNEAREELERIAAALLRIENGEFGICISCGDQISEQRLAAFPQANKCIDCASLDEERERLTG
jgi:RNA polymerase-binding transcription factor